MKKFKKPPAPRAWAKRFHRKTKWSQIWRITDFFTTPRDRITWMKMWHRNLYVGGRGGMGSTTCICCKHSKENMYHLTKCRDIHRRFWKHVLKLMDKMELDKPEHIPSFLAVGRMNTDEAANEAQTGILFLAWRCVYAEIIRARDENNAVKLEAAYKRFIGMLISRLIAYGAKWKKMVHKKQKHI